MSRKFIFKVSASLNELNYHTFLKDRQEIDKVSQNLEKSQLWGWCVPEIRIKFNNYNAVCQLSHGSYASEEDFRSSPDYDCLEEEAIHSIQFAMDSDRKAFKEIVEEYYKNHGEKYNDLNQRLVRFE